MKINVFRLIKSITRHFYLFFNGFFNSQVFVDQMNEDVVGITRHNPQTHDTVILVARTAFDWGKVHRWTPNLKHFPFGGHLEEVIFEMEFLQLTDQWNEGKIRDFPSK